VIRERELGIRATPAPVETATKAKKTKAKKADAADEAVKEEAE
jgi:large subunit ribosomal protein L29